MLSNHATLPSPLHYDTGCNEIKTDRRNLVHLAHMSTFQCRATLQHSQMDCSVALPAGSRIQTNYYPSVRCLWSPSPAH